MLRINVIELNDQEHIDSIENPDLPILELAGFYKEKLAEASLSQAEEINFESISFVEKNSDNFRNISILEKGIMEYLKGREFPKRVQIVCRDSKIAELYKVVYNFYYPGTKDDCLRDESWD